MAEQIKFGDRLFLKGEKLVLDNGVNPGKIMSENGTVQIEGDLLVTGNMTTVSSEVVTIADNFLTLNSNVTGTPTENAGFEIERGDETNVQFAWNESDTRFSTGDQTFHAHSIITPMLTGDVTGNLTGNVTSSGSTFSGIDINGGTIDGTAIGATTPAAGNFTLITGDGTELTNIFTNYTSDSLTEGSTNLFFTNERVDDRIDALFTSAYGITGTYNDAGDEFTLAFDPVNAGSAIAVLDITDTTQAKFRTIREGQVASGGHGDLTVALSGDEIVIDTTSPINQLAYNSYTGNGSVSVYTLPYSVSQDWQALVYIDGVIQHPVTNYSISGTTLTLTTPLPNTSKMNVIKMATNSIASPITDANTLGGNAPAHFLDWANFTGTPTTIAGYGITDATNVARQAIFVSGDLNYDSNSGEISTTFTLPANIVYDNSHQALHWSSALSISGNVITLTKGDSSTETVTVPAGYTDAMADARAQLKIDALVDSAPGSLDTLNELAAALGDDANFSTTITNQIAAMSPTGTIIPSADDTYDLGSTTTKYANIYGHSIHAHYADMAERYATDVPYESGTVVVLGGEAEITVTSEARDVAVAGVISTNPAIKLNADAGDSETHPYVALRGRVPCKMIGPVSKGDLIVTADNEPGYAQSVGKENAGRSVFAKSIETDLTEGKRLIEVVIL